MNGIQKTHRNRKRVLLTGILLILATAVLSGCTSKKEREANEAKYRASGIEKMQAGNYTDAITDFNAALAEVKGTIGPNEIDICYYKAAAQYAAGDLSGAIATYGLLAEYDKSCADTYFLRAGVYLKQKENDKALEDYKTAVKNKPEISMYLEIYENLIASGLTEEAKSYLEQGVKQPVGSNAANYKLKGDMYLTLGNDKEAIEQYTKALDKGDTDANLSLSEYYRQKGDTDKSQTYIAAYIKANPESSVAYNALGMQKLQANDAAGAVDLFKKGLAMENVTNKQELRSNLIAAYEAAGNFADAKTEMQTYITDYPDDADAQREWEFLQSR